jgi:hypothetical protein
MHRRTLCSRLVLGGLFAILILVIAPSEGGAHNLGESYLYLQVRSDSISGRFEIALSDLNPALGLEGTVREITPQNFSENVDFLQDYYLEHVTISAGQKRLAIEFTGADLLEVRGGYALLPFDLGGFAAVPDTLTFDYSVLFDEEPSHRGFLLIESNWATGTFANENQISLVFSPSSRRQDFDLTSSGVWQGFRAVVGLGVEHIWMGVDHVLFLIALLLPAVMRREDGRWQPVENFSAALIQVIKIVTAFTVAHSVTLSLAALGVLELPGTFVEVVIAASIAIAAGDILVPLFRGRIWLVVFGFGLFHGFGFAGALSEMGVLGEHLGLSLFAFNLGVEIGQVVIVAALFPLLFLVRRLTWYRKVILPAAAVFMILVSSAWVVERAFGVHFEMTRRAKSIIRSLFS